MCVAVEIHGVGAGRGVLVLNRYVPKHRKRRQVAARRAMAHASALFIGGAVLLSGAYGSGPVLLSAAPLTAQPGDTQTTDDPGFPSVLPPAPPTSNQPAGPTNRSSLVDPAFVDIPAIGSTSTIERLGTLLDGRLETPNDFMKVGWWSGGAVPGAIGPAVLAGHLDSVQGPAIFAKLHLLTHGDRITVARRDGVVLHFEVTRVDRYPKDLFPASQVYGPTSARELRVITCGGRFDRQARSYTDNTVVYATLVDDDLGLVDS